MNVIEANALGKRYGSTWALRECTLAIPDGHVAALVGPNGAGKTTLLNLAVGLTDPTAGTVAVLGGRRAGSPAALDGIAFVAQDAPLYKNLSVADMLHLTRNLNRHFDQGYAEARLGELGIPLKRKAGKLSGGQQAQLALTLALARRPRLLVLDEPMAMLDPLARHDFMATVMTAMAEDGVSVVLSSHVLAELERVADYLILVSRGRRAGGRRGRRPARPPPRADRPGRRSRQVHRTTGRGARLARRGTGSPADQDEPNHRPGAAGMGGAPGDPRRTRPGLPARARRRGAARPGAAAGTAEPSEVTQMTALTVPARLRGGREPAAGAVAADGLGHLAAAPDRAGRRGRVSGRAGGVAVDRRPSAAPRLRRRDRLPPGSSPACADLITNFNNMNHVLIGGYVLQTVPALIGAFVGAPVLARELETGTFRYAWTQGFGRWRWTLAKLVPLAVAVAAAAGAISVLFSWYYQPYLATGNQALSLSAASPLSPGLFDLRGVAFAAWTLAAFAIGALAGMLIRRVVPAIVATLAAYTGLALVAGNLLRQHYLTPLVTSNPNVPGSAWITSQWWTKGGKFAFALARPPIDLAPAACALTLPRGLCGKPLHQATFVRSASPSTATRSGPATSRPAGSGRSSGSRAAGCSRCRCCSSP